MPSAHRHRLTSRILLFDREGRVLLFLTKAPDSSGFARWITPGGGVDPGEDHPVAAVRELFEETGLAGVDVGESVWTLDFDVAWDEADHDTGHAEYYTAVVDGFEPSNANWTDDEHVDVLAHRWWTLDELIATDEPFEPEQLIDLIREHRPSHPDAAAQPEGEQPMPSELDDLVATLEAQQATLLVDSFDHDDAWALGASLVELARERSLSITIDVTIGDQQVFHAALPGTTADNDYWVARKIRTVEKFGESSFLVGRRHAAAGTDFTESTGLPFTEYVAHGGSIPIASNEGLLGTATVSGLPQADDHALVVEALERFLARRA